MNAQQLRNSILQEAIEGRLVSQDPNDEPTSVLLERIRDEKKRLVKEKKITLSKPEKACVIKKDGEFPLPQNWKWGMVNDICRVFGRIGFRGYTKNDLRYSPENAAISISPSNMVNGTMDFSNCTYISEEKYEESPEIKIQNGDILIVKTGSSYGKTSLVENLPWKSTINPQIAVVKDVKVNRKYLVYYFQSPYAQSKFKDFVLGTSIPTFSQLNLISMQIPLPPLAEQKRIVEKIEELLPKVEEYGKAQDALDRLNNDLPERLKKSILQEAIEGRLVPQDPNDEPASVLLERIREEKKRLVKEGKLKKKDLVETPISEDEKPFDIPEGWEWCRMSEFVNILNGFAFKSHNYVNKGIRVIRITNVQSGRIVDNDPKFYPESEAENLEKYMLKEGDLLMSLTGNVGRVGIIDGELLPAALNQRVACLRFFCESIKQYLYLYLQTEHFRIKCVASGKGMAQLNISTDWLANDIIPIPPLAEQKRIVSKIEELMKEIDKLKA